MGELNIIQNEKREGLLKIDPRTKLIIMILGNVAIFIAPNIYIGVCIFIFYLLFGFLCGTYNIQIKIAIGYFTLILLGYLTGKYLTGAWALMLISFSQLMCMVFPCALLASIMIATTKVNEFMAALYKIHVSKEVIIPFTVMLRYLPVISEDWKKIKDAMKMRDVTPSLLGFLKRPLDTIECIYVPFLMSASKVADELSTAAITRAIENPKQRTCMVSIEMKSCDYLCIFLIVAVIFIEILLKAGVLCG